MHWQQCKRNSGTMHIEITMRKGERHGQYKHSLTSLKCPLTKFRQISFTY